jgi:hypothetical protein
MVVEVKKSRVESSRENGGKCLTAESGGKWSHHRGPECVLTTEDLAQPIGRNQNEW